MRLRQPPGPARRRGVILLIVLVMLTLFAIAGLTFVLYADANSESARINKDAETFSSAGGPDMDPNAAFDLFLGQLIYGLNDNDGFGPYSALRGQSLAETMTGSYDAVPSGANYVPMDQPYNGPGALHYTNSLGVDDYTMPNFTYFASDNFARDPGRYGTRANVNAATPRGPFVGQNAPYTYWDRNSMFLAGIQQGGANPGTLLTQSYYRSSLFDPTGLGLNNPANPNWTNAQGKYLILRPRPADMGFGFPMPADAGGDVKNLVGAPGGNDSMWIDINGPELSTAAGLKYKMLVAPLILDLDNRINLNVVGNVFATANANGNFHAGNQAWGAWEMNMSKVLNVNATEWKNLFLGNGTVYGRYGQGQLPTATFAFNPNAPVPHVYAPADLNSVIDPGQAGQFMTTTPRWALPGQDPVNTVPFQSTPYWPPQAYGNGGVLELKNAAGNTSAHPMFYNPVLGSAGNLVFPINSHALLLWAGIPASPTSNLVQLSPNNYSATNTALSRRIINETTCYSFDLDRPSIAPYVWDPTNPAYSVSYSPTTGAYTYGANPPPNFPSPTTFRSGATPANSEFNPNTWQSVLPAALPRIDLDRVLTPYTGPNGNPAQAAADRQQFATDIYTRLLAVTGMTAVNSNVGTATAAQYNTLRWLAQLSANIVDYIDTDDVMTAFQWTASPQAPDTGYVFGTELPKLVLNEVYLQYNNDPNDKFPKNGMMVKTASLPYKMNVWAELLNPLPSGADANGSNQAVLQNAGGTPIYQVVLTKPNANLRTPGNTVGNPDNSNQTYTGTGNYSTAGQVLSVFNSWGAGAVVNPAGQNYGNGASATAGFAVLGPQTTVQGLPTATFQSPSMTYTVNYLPSAEPTADAPVAPTVMLQRLANPNVAFNAVSNPYVTVDYVDLNPLAAGGPPPINPAVNDARTYNSAGPIGGAPTQPYTTFSSYGRNEPYASLCVANAHDQWLPQKPSPLSAAGPQNSFFQQNVNASTPGPNVGAAPAGYPAFDWLVHMDRPLVSPVELVHVSGFKPSELTQQFIDSQGNKFGHIAPWTDPNARLYRLLEFVKVRGSTPFFPMGGRVPGKININTVDSTALEVFEALCNAAPGNGFANDATGTFVGDQYVNQVFAALTAARTPNGAPGPNDHPYWGWAQGPYPAGDPQYPNGSVAGNTLLTAANSAALPSGSTHPYQKMELLNKICNNITTRSNTFAVWLTVGFFQVTDDTVLPMKLGAEVNLAQGTNIRHHMFAIVDRTQIQTFSTKTTAAIAAGANVAISVPATVLDTRVNGPGHTWQIQPGATLVYEPNTANEETVIVQAGMTANFTLSHPMGATVISRGHPGPWKQYDPSQDSAVVPYLVIID